MNPLREQITHMTSRLHLAHLIFGFTRFSAYAHISISENNNVDVSIHTVMRSYQKLVIHVTLSIFCIYLVHNV